MRQKGMPALAVLCCATLLAAGCSTSPIPLSENFELTSQQKVRSAGHWELVARDVIAQTSAFIDAQGIARDAAFFIEEADEDASSFEKAFREFLITEMVQSGKTVSTQPGAAVKVSYDTQIIHHNSARPHFVPGLYTMIATGVAAAYGVSTMHVDAQIAAAIGAAGGLDYVASINSGGPTHTELILTTTLSSGQMYLARKTDVYYLEDADTNLFQKQVRPAPVRSFKVVAE